MSTVELSLHQVQEAVSPYGGALASPQSIPHRSSPPPLTTNSYSSSPECRPIDPRIPIPEEDEDEDETSSERTANEPLTPTESHHSHPFHDDAHDGMNPHDAHVHVPVAMSKPPLIISTPASPPQPRRKSVSPTETPAMTPSQTVAAQSPPSRPTSSRDMGIRRGISQIFRRSNSSTQNSTPTDTLNQFRLSQGGSEILPTSQGRRMSAHQMTNSNATTRSNSPPSPGSPTDTSVISKLHSLEPHPDQFLNNKKNRSATGLSIRNKFITFAHGTKKQPKIEVPRERATSVEDLKSNTLHPSPHGQPELRRNPWALAPDEGTGLKARRLSLSLPDDFTVDVVELNKEFSDQSKLIGRRGKTLGKGATSTVKLMVRKGTSTELYAVKEFRGKQSAESADEYENKVKSEYCIAKSLHHPSIVETVRLCTHHGRWNHVMEFCGEGDLFSFVRNGFLKQPDRKFDRLCLFKQLVMGIQYLHSHGIAHRDIKLENLLVTSDSKLKITDFGVSEVFCGIHPGLRAAGGECGKEMSEVRLCSPGICGSMPYIAPEVINKQADYDPRPLDVWSSAVVMLHLIFGGALWQQAVESSENPQYTNLVKGWRKWEAAHPVGATLNDSDYPYFQPFDLAIDSPVLRRILMGMLHPDAAKRWTIEQVATHRWMKTVECCQLDSYEDPTKVFDVSKSGAGRGLSRQKVVRHNHLIPASHKGHGLVRLPGSTDMD